MRKSRKKRLWTHLRFLFLNVVSTLKSRYQDFQKGAQTSSQLFVVVFSRFSHKKKKRNTRFFFFTDNVHVYSLFSRLVYVNEGGKIYADWLKESLQKNLLGKY
jgi:hypothetical protein